MGSQTVGHDWVTNTQQRTLQWINVLSWIWWILPNKHLWSTLGLPFPCGSAGKESPAMRETWVWSLGWKDPLEKGKAIHSCILAWRSPRTAIVHGVAKSRTQFSDFHLKKKSLRSCWRKRSFNPYWSCWECAKERTWSIFSLKVLFYYHEHLTLSEFRVSIVEPRKVGYSPGLCVCWLAGLVSRQDKKKLWSFPGPFFWKRIGKKALQTSPKSVRTRCARDLGGRKKVKVSVAQ